MITLNISMRHHWRGSKSCKFQLYVLSIFRTEILQKTFQNKPSRNIKSVMTQKIATIEPLLAVNQIKRNMLERIAQTSRNKSVMGTHTSPKMDTTLKPILIESRLANHEEFFNLTNGFQQVLTEDKKDRKMVLPVCGYMGHRRGDRSQNYFGKSFRETTI